VVRFLSERAKGTTWLFKGGQWNAVTKWKYLYVVPLLLIPVLFFVYTLEVGIGFIHGVNGVVLGLVVAELFSWGFKVW
jgi:hypothetical protein